MKKSIFLLLFIVFIQLFSACSFMTGEVYQIDVIETENGQYKINKTEAIIKLFMTQSLICLMQM